MHKLILLAIVFGICPISFEESNIEKHAVSFPSGTLIVPDLTTYTPASNKPSAQDNENLKQTDWYSSAMKYIALKEYQFSKLGDTYTTPNRKNNLRFVYDEAGFTVKPRTTRIPLKKYPEDTRPEEMEYKTLPDWNIAFHLDKTQIGEGTWQVSENRAEYVTEKIIVQYVNNQEGMRQNFIVQSPLSGNKELRINFGVETNLVEKLTADGLQFSHHSMGQVLTYEQLKVWDAKGKALQATFQKADKGYAIQVDTDEAVYPITIDPLTTTMVSKIVNWQYGSSMGCSVAGIGDVNRDGYDDVLVGASTYDGSNGNGAAFIFHGGPTGVLPIPATILEGNGPGSYFGSSVASAGDVNHDGYQDIIIAGSTGGIETGVAFIFHGSSDGIIPVPVVRLEGFAMEIFSGTCVAGAGDVNGDGYDDVIIGGSTYGGAARRGSFFIHHGSATGILPTEATKVIGNANSQLGYSVSGAGDVNGDGYADVVVATRESKNVFVYYGSSTGILMTASPVTLTTTIANIIQSVSSAGDVNNDGYADIIVGGTGVALIFHGSISGVLTTASATLIPDFDVGQFGKAVSSSGDMNKDGYSDVLIGATGNNGLSGAAFVYYGSASGILTSRASYKKLINRDPYASMGSAIANAGDLDSNGYDDVIVGAPNYYEPSSDPQGAIFIFYGSEGGFRSDYFWEINQGAAGFGASVSSAGDVNNDGYSDVVVGAPYYDDAVTNAGAAFIYHGSQSGLSLTPGAVFKGSQKDANFGISVAGVGDVNGDGFGDVMVGASRFDQGETDEGVAYIYHGSATGLQTTATTLIEGNQSGTAFGYSVAAAGDVNADGYSDVIVGAYNFTNGQGNVGAAFVFYGSLTGVDPQTFTGIEGDQARSAFGWSVAGAGDVNGDGFSDIIVGARLFDGEQSNEGAAFVYHGSTNGLNTTPVSKLGINSRNAAFGHAVACAGDVNGDGYSDVIVGAETYTNGHSSEGGVFIYHGSASGISNNWNSHFEGNGDLYQMGTAVASAGDVNGDGYGDVVFNVKKYRLSLGEGLTLVYQGSASGINEIPLAQFEGAQTDIGLGASPASAGDVNGDGYSDLVLGVYSHSHGQISEGAMFMYYGAPSAVKATAQAKVVSGQADAQLGYSVAGAGDVNGDGFSDVIVGVPSYDNGEAQEGAAFVYLGSSTGLSVNAVILEGNSANAELGKAVAGAGDVNGDGYADVIVGAPGYSHGETGEGAAFIFHGSASGLNLTPAVILESNLVNSMMGSSVSGAGDVNGDGYSDVVVGLYGYGNGQANEGAAFIYHGSLSGISNTPVITLESDQIDAHMGNAVSSAGDVNGDGYGDVMVGAFQFDNFYADEGAVFLFLGSKTGISSSNARQLLFHKKNAHFGNSLSAAGDVNGDGYGDVVIASFKYGYGTSTRGRVYIYHGSKTASFVMPATTIEIAEDDPFFGNSVSGAGDVNGDGYNDIVIGAPYHGKGLAFVHHGSAEGISKFVATKLASDKTGTLFGFAVAVVGDVNGDGVSDVMVGAYQGNSTVSGEGAAFLYASNKGKAILNGLDLYHSDQVTPIGKSNFDDPKVGIGFSAKSFLGRTKVKLVWQTWATNEDNEGRPSPNSVSYSGQHTGWADLGLEGLKLKSIVAKEKGPYTKIRARIKYDPITAITGQMYGPWRYVEEQTSASSLGAYQSPLLGLALSEGTLSPGFNGSVKSYTASVGSTTESVTLTPITSDASKSVQVSINGDSRGAVSSNNASSPLALAFGMNQIEVTPPFADVYRINVLRPFNPPGNALTFDGLDDNITIDNNSLGNFRQNAFTIEMYVRTTQATGSGSVLNKRNVCGLTSYVDMIIADGKLKFVSCSNNTGLNYNPIVGTTMVADGKWHHIAVTRDGTLISLYVDGKLDIAFTATGVADIDNSLNPDPIKIGNNLCNNIFTGSIDELRIWDIAKTQAQLQEARFGPLLLPAANLLAYYNFDIGPKEANPAFADLSGSEDHGTLNNFDPASRVESYAMVVPVPAAGSAINATDFTANWSAPVTGTAERYFLDVSTSETFAAGNFLPGYEALEVNATSKKATLPSTESGRQMAGITYYYYRVSADKTSAPGQGANSPTITVTFNPLPVTLVSFTGKRVEKTNVLEWVVTDEKQFAGYEVERSIDGKKFGKIGQVKAVANEQSTTTPYQFIDELISAESAISGNLYYRLKMIDLDGSFAMSRIVAIKNEADQIEISSIYPNPMVNKTGFVDIRMDQAGSWETRIVSTAGILLSTNKLDLQKGFNKIRFELKGILPGIHLIKFDNGAQQIVRKIVVE